MQHFRILLAGMLTLHFAPALFAQTTADQWLVKLSSHNYIEREKAAQALERLGAAALPVLDKVLASADLETKRRAVILRERIEERLIREELIKPTPLHLRLPNMPLQQALRAIEKQTGLRCGDLAGKHHRVELDSGTLPYWQAWQQFCRTAQLQESDYSRSAAKLKSFNETELTELLDMLDRRDNFPTAEFLLPRMEFAAAPTPGDYAIDDRHSIRVRLKWLTVEPIGTPKALHAVFAVELRAEPRLDIVATPKVEITRIVDVEGRALDVKVINLLPPGQGQLKSSHHLASYTGEIQYGGLLHVKAIAWPYPVRALKEIHGHVQVTLMARPRLLEVKNILKAEGKETQGRNGVTLKVLAASRTDEGEIQLGLLMNNLESFTPKTPEQQVVRIRPGVVVMRGAMDVALERLRLLDDKGQSYRLENSDYRPAKGRPGYEVELTLAANVNPLDEPTLVLTERPRNVSVLVPFEVRTISPPAKQKASEDK